jgi:hypothetical protein
MGPALNDKAPGAALTSKGAGLLQSNLGVAPVLLDGREVAMRQRVAELSRRRRLFSALRGEQPNNIITISNKVEEGRRLVCIGLARPDEKLLRQIKGSLAKIPGLTEPAVSDATWFTSGQIDPAKQSLSYKLGNRLLNFDPGFSEAEVQEALNDWLITNRPGFRAEVAFVQDAEGTKIQTRLIDTGSIDPSKFPQLQHDPGELEKKEDAGARLILKGNQRTVPAYGVGNH